MTQETSKTILLCVAGMTPQIVTETLWALLSEQQQTAAPPPPRQPQIVDEVCVITTLAGQKRIENELLNGGKGRFYDFCRDFGLDHKQIKFKIVLLQLPDCVLEDIRSATDNEHAANQICQIVQELTKDPQTRLHASVAGGRKTMGIYLTAALQLFGRVHDRLSHVLVNEQFETHREFYYKPPVPQELAITDRQTGQARRISTAEAQIHLADIPFIRLRGVLSHWMSKESGNMEDNPPKTAQRKEKQALSYSALVERAQSDLDLLESVHDLHLNLRERTVCVANRRVKLAEREFFTYLLFAYLKRSRNEGFAVVQDITREDLDAVFRLLTAARETELGLEECSSFPRFDFLAQLAARIQNNHPQDLVDTRKMFTETRSKINRKLEVELPERYLLETRGSSRYGLLVASEHITWG